MGGSIMALKKTPVFSLGSCIGYECKKKHIQIRKCSFAEAAKIISENHYSGRPAQGTKFSFLVYWKGKVSGALQIGAGIKPHQKGGFPSESTREFDRMWLSDEMPKFSETITISLLIHYIRRETDITHLISWSDLTVGNEGTIYRAANFRFIRDRVAEFFEWNGQRMHPLLFYHRHGTRKFSFLKEVYPGIKKINGKQRQFVYEIRR